MDALLTLLVVSLFAVAAVWASLRSEQHDA